MVVLNDFLPINILSLKTHISNKFIDILDDKLDYYIETSTVIKKDDKKRLFNDILKEIKNLFSSDYFLYLIMDSNYCTHKYKRGKNEGKYCAKKIRSSNPKKVYLCCSHDKDHVPKKKMISTDNKPQPAESELINKKINKLNNNNNKNKLEKKKNINIKIGDIKGYEKKSNNSKNIYSLDKKDEKDIKDIKDIKVIQLKSTINKKSNKIDNCLNKNKLDEKKNINKNDKYNHKYSKRYKWRKLDIIRDTGFIF